MAAVSETGDARLVLIGAILTALITAAGPVILALINRGHTAKDGPPAPNIDLIDDLDHINDRLSKENDLLSMANERLTRTNERQALEIERLRDETNRRRDA